MPGADCSAHQLGFSHHGSVFFAVMPGDDDVFILGNPTLKLLGIDVYGSLGARAETCRPRRCRHRGVPAMPPRHC